LVVNLAKSETVITDGQFETGAESDDEGNDEASTGAGIAPTAPSGLPPSQSTSRPSPTSAREKPESAGAKAAEPRTWVQELARGNWDHILSEVDRVGVDVALNRASSEDLFALADAARYRRQIDLARLALLAQRRRFPNSPRATEALYMLGRVEESRGDTTRALTWYDEYLRRASSGAFAAEALGRKMIIAKSGHGTDSPRLIAEAYLRQFPSGSYVGTARAILRAQ
jgi:TolA-binding protein